VTQTYATLSLKKIKNATFNDVFIQTRSPPRQPDSKNEFLEEKHTDMLDEDDWITIPYITLYGAIGYRELIFFLV
jgi:hypothetical protein